MGRDRAEGIDGEDSRCVWHPLDLGRAILDFVGAMLYGWRYDSSLTPADDPEGWAIATQIVERGTPAC